MLLKSIQLEKFLSYGEKNQAVEMRDLNLIIGPNGSGKSNLIEAVELMRSSPKDLLIPIRDGGGVRDWLWKGTSRTPVARIDTPVARIDAVFSYPVGHQPLRYVLGFTEVSQQFIIVEERIETERPSPNHDRPYLYYEFQNGHGVLNVKGKKEHFSTKKSIRFSPS